MNIIYYLFQVENDNEKYVVVSGCPKRNGIRHVKNIAMLALKLLGKMTTFKIKHKPGMMLRLRLGCHTGMSAIYNLWIFLLLYNPFIKYFKALVDLGLQQDYRSPYVRHNEQKVRQYVITEEISSRDKKRVRFIKKHVLKRVRDNRSISVRFCMNLVLATQLRYIPKFVITEYVMQELYCICCRIDPV